MKRGKFRARSGNISFLKRGYDLVIPRKYVEEAVRMISEDKSKPHRLDKYKRERKFKIQHFCSYDVTRNSAFGNYNDSYPTDTQSLLLQMQRSVSEHDWSSVARCVDFALNLNGKLLPVIWKTCFLVLFNHPESSSQKLSDFLHLCLGLMRSEEKATFLQELLTLPSSLDGYIKKSQRNKKHNADFNEEDIELV